MGIISFLALVLVVGLVVWLIQAFAPIDQRLKNLALWAAIIFLVLVFLYAIGLLPMGDTRIPRVR